MFLGAASAHPTLRWGIATRGKRAEFAGLIDHRDSGEGAPDLLYNLPYDWQRHRRAAVDALAGPSLLISCARAGNRSRFAAAAHCGLGFVAG